MAEKATPQNDTMTYDDVFRTLVNDCSALVIPVINEAFGEQYTGKEEIVPAKEVHFINQQDGKEEKRITDSSFLIIGEKTQKQYLFECQSTPDSSMLIRIFEYSTQIALDLGTIRENQLHVTIPHCVVLFLRSTRNTPDRMRIQIETPEGEVGVPVQVLKIKQYSLPEIFEKDLLFLIPFYIFTHEKKLKEYNEDASKLGQLKAEYREITEQLEARARAGRLSEYTRKTILEMSCRVLEKIAKKQEAVRKGVYEIMGGRILEYEAKDILNEGKRLGLNEGKRLGVDEGKKAMAIEMAKAGIGVSQIAAIAKVSTRTVEEWLK